MAGQSHRATGLAKAVRAVLAVVILVALSILVLLGTRIYDSLEELRAEAQDNLHWNLSQMEVDLVRLREEMRTDALSPQSSLIELRKRFDLFYSRAQNAISGKGYSVPGLDDLPLFAAAPDAPPPTDPLAEALAALEPDALSPREALEALYGLKRLADER